MQFNHVHLDILTKVVQHKNLSLAASHVGLSQPQLSRIIAKLEEDLHVVLLDRGVRRKSSWTPIALALVEAYSKVENELQIEIRKIVNKPINTKIKIGSLEGLSKFGLEYCQKLFKNSELQEIQLDIFEIGELEEKFESGELDLIFTFRVPGRQKYKNVIEVGYQSVDRVKKGDQFYIVSTFEYTSHLAEIKKAKAKVFMSNSLELRKYWLNKVGGIGWLPSEVLDNPKEGKTPVYLVGSDVLSPLLWQKVKK